MKLFALTAAFALVLATGGAGQAEAKGCIKGAIVGGVAGHMAHHGVLGAAGGCAVGHHMASKKNQQHDQQQYDQQRDDQQRYDHAPDH